MRGFKTHPAGRDGPVKPCFNVHAGKGAALLRCEATPLFSVLCQMF
jgi:hypothetical protein